MNELNPTPEEQNHPAAPTVKEPEAQPRAAHRFGFLRGQIQVPDDFDTMLQDEIIRMFEGEDED